MCRMLFFFKQPLSSTMCVFLFLFKQPLPSTAKKYLGWFMSWVITVTWNMMNLKSTSQFHWLKDINNNSEVIYMKQCDISCIQIILRHKRHYFPKNILSVCLYECFGSICFLMLELLSLIITHEMNCSKCSVNQAHSEHLLQPSLCLIRPQTIVKTTF